MNGVGDGFGTGQVGLGIAVEPSHERGEPLGGQAVGVEQLWERDLHEQPLGLHRLEEVDLERPCGRDGPVEIRSLIERVCLQKCVEHEPRDAAADERLDERRLVMNTDLLGHPQCRPGIGKCVLPSPLDGGKAHAPDQKVGHEPCVVEVGKQRLDAGISKTGRHAGVLSLCG